LSRPYGTLYLKVEITVNNSALLGFLVFTRRRSKIRVISARDVHRKGRRVYLEKAKKDSEV